MKLPVPKFKEIKELKKEGKKWKGNYIEIIWKIKKESFSPKVVITAFKTCGTAVRRNLTRRIIRNWIMENHKNLPLGMLVFFKCYKKIPEKEWKKCKVIVEKDLIKWFTSYFSQ